MNTLLKRFIAISLFFCVTISVQAVPISWQLQDVTFDDDGIATGYLVYDDDLGSIIDWDITTSGGDDLTFPSVTYDGITSEASSSNSFFLFYLLGDTNRQLRLTPMTALDGSIASVELQLGGGI